MWFGFPSKKLIVVGVTGTDGKTTTVNLIYHILNQAGYNASMISTVGAIINGKKYGLGFHVTTPSSWQIQRFLKKALEGSRLNGQGSKDRPIVVLETTSHALDQNRVWGIDFAVGVLTNITHEHLDYHKTYKKYTNAKVKLLKMAKIAVVNRDDESYEQSSKFKVQPFASVQGESSKLITYGRGRNADVNFDDFKFQTKLFGEFNKYNILAAAAVCRSLGLSDNEIGKGIESFSLPIGRQEIVFKGSFTAMVDFAHTPNAFEKVLAEVRKQTKGRVIHVFGSAGKRDASKRPLMGETSAKYTDVIVLTAEDPRGESVEKINAEIESGIKNYESRMKEKEIGVHKIPDRREAIKFAISMAKKGDFILITGKSHEKSMNYGRGEEAWDEFEVVNNALKAIKQ